MKTPEELISPEKEFNKADQLFAILKEIFDKDDDDLNIFLDKLGIENKKKLEEFSHFYYFICQPFEDDENFIREELKLIGITSLVEGMMQEVEYQDFFQWFESTYKKSNQIEDYQQIKKEYFIKFGATKKIKNYFDKYIIEADKEDLIEYIMPFSNSEGFSKVKSINEIAGILYSMRSEFVHEAKMCHLCPEGCSFLATCIKKRPYKIEITMKKFMDIFKKSFVKFWEEQANLSIIES